MNSDTQTNIEPFQDPQWNSLPVPEPCKSGSVLLPFALGLIAASVLGGILWALAHAFYVYILYNTVIGAGIGMAMAKGIERVKCVNEGALLGAALLLSVVPYAAMHLLLYREAMVNWPAPKPDLWEFLVLRARFETLWSIKLGVAGNSILWLIEIGITFAIAVGTVSKAARMVRIQSVPRAVLEFVASAIFAGADQPTVNYELRKRGWSSPEDQMRAFVAAMSFAEALQEEAAEKS